MDFIPGEAVYIPEQDMRGRVTMPTPEPGKVFVELDERHGHAIVVAQTDTMLPVPGPEREDWIDFLRFLADHYDANAVVSVVEKPHHHSDWYREYRELGGVER